MSGLISPATAIIDREVKRFTIATNQWARIMRAAMARPVESKHIHRLVMWKEVEGGPPHQGIWYISELEKLELERIARVQAECMERIEAAAGPSWAADLCQRLIAMMRERYPDLVDWTMQEPVREGVDGTA